MEEGTEQDESYVLIIELNKYLLGTSSVSGAASTIVDQIELSLFPHGPDRNKPSAI